MRTLITIVIAALSLNAFGQVNPNYDPDYDLDGNITVNDLLGFLSNFGVTWNSDNIIMGCTYSNYYEYNPDANYDDGSCATLLLLNLIGCEDDNAVYYHGHLYEIIKIGNQCWFKENLQSQYYRNGDIINSLLTDEEWINTTSGCLATYGEGDGACVDSSPLINACDPIQSSLEYGSLYNFYAVNDSRNLCPSGWHVPFEEDFISLIYSVGGSEVAVEILKSSTGWAENNNGSNETGFSARPGGLRVGTSGQFAASGLNANFWSSSSIGTTGAQALQITSESISASIWPSSFGLSVRCLRNSDAVIIFGCMDENYLEYNPDATIDDGSCQTFDSSCMGQDYINYQGYDYAVVDIGGDCWFAENLRSENYRNGTPIESNLTLSEWLNTSSGARTIYGSFSGDCSNLYQGDFDACDPNLSLEVYGRLYNYFAVIDPNGLCPSGWHVPTDNDWAYLEVALGMDWEEAFSDELYRGTDQGLQMKSISGWFNNGNGWNSSGFNGLPGGIRSCNGFAGAGSAVNYWTSTSAEWTAWCTNIPLSFNTSWTRRLQTGDYQIVKTTSGCNEGHSVRCIKD